MKLRQKLVLGLLTAVMLVLAVSAMSLIILRTRPITTERLAVPDIQQ